MYLPCAGNVTELSYRPLLKGTNRHEQGTPLVDGGRIGTTEFTLKNSYTVSNNIYSVGIRACMFCGGVKQYTGTIHM